MTLQSRHEEPIPDWYHDLGMRAGTHPKNEIPDWIQPLGSFTSCLRARTEVPSSRGANPHLQSRVSFARLSRPEKLHATCFRASEGSGPQESAKMVNERRAVTSVLDTRCAYTCISSNNDFELDAVLIHLRTSLLSVIHQVKLFVCSY